MRISIGEELVKARGAKGFSLDRAADETNIAKRYLQALEAEDFAQLPGDTYVIGFLRSYCDYLGLPADEMISSYKGMKIEEQPIPIQELIVKKKPPVVLAISISVLVLAIAGIVLFKVLGPQQGKSATSIAKVVSITHQMTGSSFEKRVYTGDSILVHLGADDYKMSIAAISDKVTVTTPTGSIQLTLGEEQDLSLQSSGHPDVKALVMDLLKTDPAKGALLQLTMLNASPDGEAAATANGAGATTGAVGAAGAAGASSAAVASATAAATAAAAAATAQQSATAAAAAETASAAQKAAVLMEASRSPYPFVMTVRFLSSCMFRFQADSKPREEKFFRKDDNLVVNANNSIKLWTSNASAAKVSIQASGGKSAELSLGDPGQVSVKRIFWTKTDAGNWNLTSRDVD